MRSNKLNSFLLIAAIVFISQMNLPAQSSFNKTPNQNSPKKPGTLLPPGILTDEDETEFMHLTAEDGLSLNGVTTIMQDSRGFLWIGTYNGLNRYDGYNFKIFLPNPLNPNSISNHSIAAIHEDRFGSIWIATLDGLNKYDWKTEEFQVYRNNPDDPNSISNNNIYSILEDKSGTMWFGTLDGLNKYHRAKDNFTVIKKVNDIYNPDPFNSVVCIEEDHKGILWLGTWNGLVSMQKDGKIINKYFAEPYDSKFFDYRKILTILEDNQKNLWVGTNHNGLQKYDYKTGKFTQYNFAKEDPNTVSHEYIKTIFQDRSGILWVGTRNGFNKFNSEENNFTRILHDPRKPLSIINNEIFSVIEDNTGLIWIGTAGGISRFNKPINKFNYISEASGIKPGLSSRRVYSSFIDKKENLWVATFEGLDEIKPGGKIIHYRNEPGNKNSLSSNFILSVKEDHLGYIWVGTQDNGLNRYNPRTGEYKLYNSDITDKKSLSNEGVTAICEDHTGTLWFGTWWGLNKFDRKTEKFTRYLANPSNKNTIKNDLVWIIYEDSKDMLWIGTDGGGVSMLDPKTNTFTHFTKDTSNLLHISENRVFTVLETRDGIMWFGTSDGLNSYNRKTGKINIYNKECGLPGNLINSMQEDDKGFLWISTDKGLSKFDRKSGIFFNYTKRNGLKELEFMLNVSAKSKDDIFYFGCKSGIMFFHPDSIKDEYLSAPVVFTDLKMYNQSVPISQDGSSLLNESIINAKSISIPFGNDVITLEFAFLDFFNSKKNNFSFKLAGFDSDWNEVGSRNSATYTNLPPGEYKFIVKASNNDGIKNQKEASIQITIVPLYYQTWWFKAVGGLGILIATLLIIREKTRKITKQNKILENHVAERTKDLDKTISNLSQEITERRKAEERARASLKEKEILLKEKEVLLKEIHHRVKNNLQVISSLLYLNSKKIKDKEPLDMFKDSQNRVKSIALVHERLYQSKDLGKIDFRDYVHKLTNDLFRSYAVNQSLIKLETNINNIFVNIDTAVPFGLIINELISNTLKYAFPCCEEDRDKKIGLIKIDFNRNENNELILIVSDNGIGMPEGFNEKKKLSLGLQLVDTLVAQLEGTLDIDLNSGTTFKIKIKN